MRRIVCQMFLGLLFVLGSGIHGTWANPIVFFSLSDRSNLKLLTERHSPSWQSTFPGATTAVSPVEMGIAVWGAIKSNGGLK